MRFWKAYPSVHCSVKDAPCLTVVKWPSRSRSCMLLSRHAIFSCLDWWKGGESQRSGWCWWLHGGLKSCLFKKQLNSRVRNWKQTFSISSFLDMVTHLFKRSLYRSSIFCCSSICLLRSQFAWSRTRGQRGKGSGDCHEHKFNVFGHVHTDGLWPPKHAWTPYSQNH